MAETTKKNNEKAKTTKIRAKVGAEAETVANKDVETAPEVVSNTGADVMTFTEAEIAKSFTHQGRNRQRGIFRPDTGVQEAAFHQMAGGE